MNVGNKFLQLQGATKRYGGVTALNDVSFEAARGSIHAVLGENGAGKSTLMKILAGVVRSDAGTVKLAGAELRMSEPAQALREGIVCIFQELSLVPHLSVAENICLANPPRGRLGFIDAREQRRQARAVLAEVGCDRDIDVRQRCTDLPLSQRQIVEIAKAVARRPRVLILDEATSALTAADVQTVMKLLRKLRDAGTCVLFISHRMHEVDALADTCSVFRNGEHVATFQAGTRSHSDIVQLMIGRPISQVYPPKPIVKPAGKPYLQVKGLAWNGCLKGIDMDLRPGEVVGLGGLDGQGQRELLLALGGVLRDVKGEIRIGSQQKLPNGPGSGKRPTFGLALIPEDRKTEGLFLAQSVRDNLGMAALGRISRHCVVDRGAEEVLVERMIEALQIKAPSAAAAVSTLSGGNQQKVVLGKWLATEPKMLLLMDPTRGVDVGTKQEIYRLFRQLALDGMAILVYSTDYDELIGLCDRVLVMYDGRVRAALSGDSLNEHQILMNALNLDVAPVVASAPKLPAAPPQLRAYA